MKQILYKITILVIALIASSCDDFLDIQPIGKVMPKTGSEFRALITEAYNGVPSDRGLTSYRSDEIILDRATATADELNSYLGIWNWEDDERQETTSSFSWRSFYHVLYIANFIIEQQNNIIEITEIDRQQLVGEAYMLRAYMHFLLVNLYAQPYTHCVPATTIGIPLKESSDVDAVLTRNTVEQVYQSILKDINSAGKLLNKETWDVGQTYRFNTLSVDALRARTYLYMGKWEDAHNAALRILEKHPALEDVTTSSILPNHYTSCEAILSLEMVMTAQYQSAGRVANGLLNSYRSGDMRKSKFYRQATASVSKVVKGGNNQYRCTFRTAEFYLIAAETAVEMNDLETAQSYLLQLVQKRMHPSRIAAYEKELSNMDIPALRQEIYNERFRELSFEGHRWFDLRRTTQPQLEKTYAGTTYTLKERDARYTLRIPSEAIAANPELSDEQQ